MANPRVVIRAFTCRRDVACASLLAELLRRMDCDVLIAGVRDFERTVTLWNPHILVVNTLSGAENVKAKWPQIPTIFYEGEGLRPEDSTSFVVNYYTKHKSRFDAADMILLWGPRSYDLMEKKFSAKDMSKVHLAGNPNLDLARFMPESMSYDPSSTSVGFVSRFARINDHESRPAIRIMADVDWKVDMAILQCRGFVTMIKAIKIVLERTDLSVSIRAHPLEQIESYQEYKERWFGKQDARRVKIDTSLSFSQWAVKQRAILSPASTSFLKAYILRVPVINIDGIGGYLDEIREIEGQFAEEWLDAGAMPRTEDELAGLVTTDLPSVSRDESIDQQLIDYSNFGQNSSACYAAAKHISKLAHSVPSPGGIPVPKAVLDLIDKISFKRAVRKNRWHQNMNYRRGYHQLPKKLDQIVDDILMRAE